MAIYIIIEVTIVLVGIILFFTIKNFLPSYFNEKGKNLATKEDVEEITKKVEKIKSEFIKDVEYIKADLSFINQNKFSIKAFERDALIETNNKYSEWLNYLMNISFSDINNNNYDKLNDYYKEIKVKKLNFDITQDNLHLFLHDEELMDLKMKCTTETLTLDFIITKTIMKFIDHYDTKNFYFSSIMNLPEDKKPDEDFIKQQMESSQNNLDKIFNTMNDEKLKQFAIVHKNRVLFVNALKQRLYNIMQ